MGVHDCNKSPAQYWLSADQNHYRTITLRCPDLVQLYSHAEDATSPRRSIVNGCAERSGPSLFPSSPVVSRRLPGDGPVNSNLLTHNTGRQR